MGQAPSHVRALYFISIHQKIIEYPLCPALSAQLERVLHLGYHTIGLCDGFTVHSVTQSLSESSTLLEALGLFHPRPVTGDQLGLSRLGQERVQKQHRKDLCEDL